MVACGEKVDCNSCMHWCFLKCLLTSFSTENNIFFVCAPRLKAWFFLGTSHGKLLVSVILILIILHFIISRVSLKMFQKSNRYLLIKNYRKVVSLNTLVFLYYLKAITVCLKSCVHLTPNAQMRTVSQILNFVNKNSRYGDIMEPF